MQKLGDPRTHLRLMCRMGKQAGVDLVQAHQTGQLSQADWAEMVQACRACSWGTDCEGWLDRSPPAGETPETCPNASRFLLLHQSVERSHHV